MPLDHAQDLKKTDRKAAAKSIIAVWPQEAVPLRQLLRAQLANFAKRVEIHGPEVVLEPVQAIGLATLINELAVNAAKYGALSVSSGRVSLRWSLDERRDPATLHFLWEETGGLRVVSPRPDRFGPPCLEEMARDLGKPRFDYPPGGMRCEVELLLDRVGLRKPTQEAAR